ncbi:serine hydrolase domain-containing protein [Amycolatopsis benzoatilytica]|uniref:serine hydrolase domain-containing protein n=1 Tax=Amycolatopsis benzoatilytica TaxID=346045 RepID=UPI0003638D2D|nr:serine hydrolase domain-containing protein [Amycolatopsis benzoatilytica]
MRKTLTGLLAVALMIGGTPAVAMGHHSPQRELNGLVRENGFPAALAAVTVADGGTALFAAGTSELGRYAPAPANGRVRAGSNTKAFVAVVVMQLVAEGKVELDRPITRYLPGVVKDDRITVRQLLQHTSGLPDYADYLGIDQFESLRHRYFEPHELIDIANAHPLLHAPGEKFAYSNTNYVLLGLLIQQVTGRPVSEQIDQRILRELGLRDTYWPGVGVERIRGRYLHGYFRVNGVVTDVTEADPSWAWAAGQLITTGKDLNTFFRAVLGGKLVPSAQLAEMRKTVDSSAGMWPGAEYGLGLVSTRLSCGGKAWGHGGDIPGYETRTGVTDDGRAVTVAVNAVPGTAEGTSEGARQARAAVLSTVDSTLCR